MTWQEWVNSSYNTGNFSVLEGAVQTNNYIVYNEDTGKKVNSSDTIDPNVTYITIGGGAGD